jgi:hypothetical protein
VCWFFVSSVGGGYFIKLFSVVKNLRVKNPIKHHRIIHLHGADLCFNQLNKTEAEPSARNSEMALQTDSITLHLGIVLNYLLNHISCHLDHPSISINISLHDTQFMSLHSTLIELHQMPDESHGF